MGYFYTTHAPTCEWQGQDSPSLKLYYLSLWLSLFQWKTLLVEKTVIVELGESWPWNPDDSGFRVDQGWFDKFLLSKIVTMSILMSKRRKLMMTNSCASIEDLPEEIVLEISSYLGRQSVVNLSHSRYSKSLIKPSMIVITHKNF